MIMKRILTSLLVAAAAALPAAAQVELSASTPAAVFGQSEVAHRALSLGEIYSRVSQQMNGGQAINTSAINGNRYLIRGQTPQGQVVDLVVDANTGRILRRT